MKCDQKGCNERAVYTYHWPTMGLMKACERHAQMARNIGENMGMVVDLAPIEPSTN